MEELLLLSSEFTVQDGRVDGLVEFQAQSSFQVLSDFRAPESQQKSGDNKGISLDIDLSLLVYFYLQNRPFSKYPLLTLVDLAR